MLCVDIAWTVVNEAIAQLMLEDCCDERLHQRIFVPIYATLLGIFHSSMGAEYSTCG